MVLDLFRLNTLHKEAVLGFVYGLIMFAVKSIERSCWIQLRGVFKINLGDRICKVLGSWSHLDDRSEIRKGINL